MASVSERVARRYLRMRGFVSREIETSLGTTHVLEAPGQGELPPVVLLHGFAASGTQMLPLLLRLQKSVQKLIVPDLPGHGFSAEPSGGLESDGLRSGLFETLDAVIDEPVVLFGNSMGGYAAITYALERRALVQRLILCSPGGAGMQQAELDEFRKVFDVNSHGEALQFVDRLLGKRSPARHVMAMSVRRRFTNSYLRNLMACLTPEDLLSADQLQTLDMPIMMVWGQEDQILPDHNREFFRTHLPTHAQIIEPAGLGHSPYLESPAALTRHILRFLRTPAADVKAGAK